MGVRQYRFIPRFDDEEIIFRRQLEGVRWTVRHARSSLNTRPNWMPPLYTPKTSKAWRTCAGCP